MTRYILLVFFLMASGWNFAADNGDGTPSASIQFKKAQQTLTMADESRDREDFDKAIKCYQDALLAYTKLSRNYPDWQPGVTQFRIAYCNNQLEALLKKIDEKQISAITADKNNTPQAAAPGAPPGKLPQQATIPANTVSKDNRTAINRIIIEARLLVEKGDTKKARSVLMDGLKLEPDEKNLRMLMGMVHCRENEFENAMYIAESLVQEDPFNAHARLILGTAYFGLGKLRDASRQMEETLAINPKSAEAHYNMSQILLSLKPANTNMARKHYKSALELGTKPDTNLNFLLLEPAPAK